MEPIWKKAVGEYIFDEKGRKYLDFTSGVMVANIGHANKVVVKEIQKIVESNLLYCYRYPVRAKQKFRKYLLDFVDGEYSQVCFAATGAEAIENSMMIASRYWESLGNKDGFFVSFSNAYHGKTLGASLLSDIKRYKSNILEAPCSNLVKKVNFPTNKNEEIETITKLTSIKKGCIGIYIECIQGSTLLKASNSFLKELRKFATKNKILLIVDEIQTGFYRTGPKFSYYKSGIKPDMICVGKGLTASLPLSLVLLVRKLTNFTSEGLDASTHSSNPLSIAASIGALKVYKSKAFRINLKESVDGYASMMKNISNAVLSKVDTIHPGGVFGGLKFNLNPDQNYKINNFVYECRRKGLFLPLAVGQNSNIVKFTPPLTIKKTQLKFAEQVIIQTLRTLQLTGI